MKNKKSLSFFLFNKTTKSLLKIANENTFNTERKKVMIRRRTIVRSIVLTLIFYNLLKYFFIFHAQSDEIRLKSTKNITVQWLIDESPSKSEDFSGEYQEFESNQLTTTNKVRDYQLEDIYFILTTNSLRIRYSINFLKFWLKSTKINCILVFEETDLAKKPSVKSFLTNNEIHCEILLSKIQRYERRYFYLPSLALDHLRKQNKNFEWLAMGDDDTIWFIENLFFLINQFNSSNLIYLGNISDNNSSIQRHGKYYAYGGAGILLSKSLVSLLANYSDVCYKKYSFSFGGDEILGKCIRRMLKVNLTLDEHLHQMDHIGDIYGLLQSGYNHLITLHHMFTLWEPFPEEHLSHEYDILENIYRSYRIFRDDFLKRYFRINYRTNQTLLLTNGYSFTIFNEILSEKQLNQVELTWSESRLYKKPMRNRHSNKIEFFFKSNNHFDFYQFRKQQLSITINKR